jgi:sulfur carrier protein ThiS
MATITLVVIPGPGARTVTIADDATVSNLVCQENLHGRDIIINGQGVPANTWETTRVPSDAEVFATGSVKGNVSTVTLVVIPGPGARTVSVPDGATVSDLVCQENLHGRDIIINGQGVPATTWQTTTVPAQAEVFATGSVKGNAKTVTLVVIPGPGARTVSLEDNSTVSDLVCQENLHGRDIIVNGQGIPAPTWHSVQVPDQAEVFATGSVKGNMEDSSVPPNFTM